MDRQKELTEEKVLEIAIAEMFEWGGHERQASADVENLDLSCQSEYSEEYQTTIFCITGSANVTYQRRTENYLGPDGPVEIKEWEETVTENYEFYYHLSDDRELENGEPEE